MNTVEHAANIRAKLKEKGWTGRQVSVRSDLYSLGSAIRINIKDPKIPSDVVEAIAEPAENIRRDQLGEILSGGNRYVTVHYTTEALEAIGTPWIAPVVDAVARITETFLIKVEGTPFLVGRDRGRLTLWKDGYITDAYSSELLARSIGVRMLNIQHQQTAQPAAQS